MEQEAVKTIADISGIVADTIEKKPVSSQEVQVVIQDLAICLPLCFGWSLALIKNLHK